MHHRVGESPSPGLTLLAIGHSDWRACRAVIFRLHRPRAAVMVAFTRRRDKHYQPNEGKAARVWCLLRVLGPAPLPALWVYAARRLGLGEDLPAPAMLQWGRWSAMPGIFL